MNTKTIEKTNEPKPSEKTVCPNVLAINASPHRNTGNTAQILNPFLEGMKEKGANVTLFCTEDLAINPCKGDLTCMIRSDGRCIHRDDMDNIIPKLRAADILVLATPLYVDDVTGPMKTLMDRMVPLLQIFIETRDGHIRHPLKESKTRRVILVSSCGFWEPDNFNVIVAHMQAFAKNITAEFSGALLRPHAASLKGMIALGAPVLDIPDAAREAGRQMVTENRISPALLETISRPLVPRDIYQQTSNQHFMEMTKKLHQDTGKGPGCQNGVR
jgi:multimeric flavodoxin WrbA